MQLPTPARERFFSEDAVTLESEPHQAFADRRVDFVNERREFFFATPSEIRALLADREGGLLEFTEEPAALEYFQRRSRWPHQS
ncbi:GIY-YIG nuclease family protein [Streptomyces sp. NPDC052107]|uniref:GIY-YIG nuclease family protein n=1 Tax=Streptomyces sp. NPDC052107 TaxID=3155632 RepID=UPI00341391F4